MSCANSCLHPENPKAFCVPAKSLMQVSKPPGLHSPEYVLGGEVLSGRCRVAVVLSTIRGLAYNPLLHVRMLGAGAHDFRISGFWV